MDARNRQKYWLVGGAKALLMLFAIASSWLPITACGPPAQIKFASQTASSIPDEMPPLITATLDGDEETVRSLLDAGTDPDLVYRTNTALIYATRDGYTDIARALIDAGADVNWIDGEGVTPLILAAFKGHVELAELLLEHGANATVVDQWDRTALDYALRRGEEDAIARLIRASQ